MMLDRLSQSDLLAALDELKRGLSRRFEDRLWLGFGDDWTAMRSALIRDGCIREVAGDVPGYALLVKGEALRLRLEESVRARAEAGGSGIRVAAGSSAK